MLTDLERLAYQAGGAGWRKMVDDMLKNGYAPPGYRLVPEVPTEEMLAAGQNCIGDLEDLWRDMCAAAPGAPKKEEGK